MTDPLPPPAPGAAVDLDDLRRAYADVVARIRATPDPLMAFRASAALLEELRLMDSATVGLRDQQVVRVRDERQLSLAGLAELFSTDAGLKIGRHRVNQMIQRAAAGPDTQEGNPAA